MECEHRTIETDFLQTCWFLQGGVTFEYLHSIATLPEAIKIVQDTKWLYDKVKDSTSGF